MNFNVCTKWTGIQKYSYSKTYIKTFIVALFGIAHNLETTNMFINRSVKKS